jgi:hypothetical protein
MSIIFLTDNRHAPCSTHQFSVPQNIPQIWKNGTLIKYAHYETCKIYIYINPINVMYT